MDPFDISEMMDEVEQSPTKPIEGNQKLADEMQRTVGASIPQATETTTEPSIADAPKFWNQDKRKPQHVIQVERPEHRAICILAAQGLTSTEISEQTGWTTATIQNVRKQEWAQAYIAQLMEKAGRKQVMSELQGAAKDAAALIIKSVRGELADQKPADRCKDAHKLLDRLYGTAPQVVMHGNVDVNDLTDEELAATIASGNS